ncbi:uncharacterized protein LOC127239417 [Andrographis paniculata]|uniref:uncharacterized protein LOC127239417 n=1 Tax=Andrographis paniculata TaxID=175694 RepID=UPI0021E865BF|nr:uncharacterized protein LOC127239417 [Andrographis paniculata]
MGNMRGHVAYGSVFFLQGLWQLLNHIHLHNRNPNSFTTLPWFPSTFIRHSELLLIIAASSAAILMDLFVGLRHHQPLDPDGSIPATHLHSFEHSIIALAILIYALFAILLDKLRAPAQYALTNALAALAFALELLVFHLHSTDHRGVEGQYHWLLQILIFTSMAATLLSIGCPKSFLVAFVRSLSIVFQGVWLVNMGVMLWTPGLIPKGCFMNREQGHFIVRCHGEEALMRAKALVNIQFSYYTVGVTSSAVALYLAIFKFSSGSGSGSARYHQILQVPRFDYSDSDHHRGIVLMEDDDHHHCDIIHNGVGTNKACSFLGNPNPKPVIASMEMEMEK